jgi:predicted DNA-binding protein
MAIKATFTLDEQTMERISRMAKRESKPKSEVVRDAIREHERRTDRISDEEKERLLRAIDKFMSEPPTRPQAEVDRELKEIRESRRRGWSRPSDPK